MGQILVYLFLGVLTIFTLYPILYVVLGSFKENQELVLGGTSMLPETFQISNYIEAWRLADFGRYTFNSVFLSTMVRREL